MPRSSSNNYEITIPVTIKDQTKSGSSSVNKSVDDMTKQAAAEAKQQMSAVESLQKQRSAAMVSQWNKDNATASRLAQEQVKEKQRIDNQAASAQASLQKQRSSALLNQWKSDQAAQQKIAQDAIKVQQKADQEAVKATQALQKQRSNALVSQWKADQAAQTKAAQDAVRAQQKIDQEGARAAESLQRQRSSALTAQWNKEQQQYAQQQKANLRAAEEAAERQTAAQEQSWNTVKTVATAALVAIAVGIGAAIVDTALYAGRTEELTIALHSLANANGISTKEIDKQLKGLTDLNIAGQDATAILGQMVAANLDLTKATSLATVARDTAVISGKNTSEAFQDLTRAILVGTTQAFRAAGVYISVRQALEQGAKALGVNKNALTEQQRQQILTNAVVAYGARLTGTYEAAMGSASKQMRSLVRVANDARQSMGELFQGLFMVAVTVAKYLLEVLAKYPAVFLAAATALGVFTAAIVVATTAAVPSLIANFVALGQVIALVGKVMIGTASLIQGASATMAVATLGWVAVAIAIGAVVYALTNEESAAAKANKITLEQIDGQKKAWEGSKALAIAVKDAANAQEGSADRHQKLNAILAQLNPATQVYIRALEDEKKQIAALTAEIDRMASASKTSLEATLRVVAGGILEEFNEVEMATNEMDRIQKQIQKEQDLIAKDPKWAANLRPAIENLSQDYLKQQEVLKQHTLSLNENEQKLVDNAKALGLNQAQLVALLEAMGHTHEEATALGMVYDLFTPKVEATNKALKEQAQTLDEVRASLKNLLQTGSLEIETKILDITKNAKNAAQARAMAREALKDPAFAGVVNERKTYTEAEKAARGVFEPTINEIQSVGRAVEKLKQQVEALRRGAGPLFNLETQKADLEETKREYEDIFKIRHKLGQEINTQIPKEQAARQALLRDLERQQRTREEILRISEEDKDNAQKLLVLQYESTQAFLIYTEADTKSEKAMRTLVDLKAQELDLAVEVMNARAKTKAIEEWFLARSGRPTLGTRTVSPARNKSLEEQALLYGEAQSTAAMTAARAGDLEIERQRQLTDKFYGESATRKKIVEEEQTARMKEVNDATEEIRRIEERLTHNLIDNDTALELARKRAAEQRRKDVQNIGIDIDLLKDQLTRLGSGDQQEGQLATGDYLKSFYGSMVGVRKELTAIKALGGVSGVFNSKDFQEAMKEGFSLDQMHETLDLMRQIAQVQYQMANDSNGPLRVQLQLMKDLQELRRADEESLKEYNKAQLQLADAAVYHAQQADTAVAKFLASQKSVTDIVADARVGVMQTTFDFIDSGLTKVTDKLGIMKSLIHDILSGFIRLALSQFFKSVFLNQSPTGGQGGGAAGGILGTVLNSVGLGGGGGAATGGGGGNGVTSGPGGGGGILGAIKNFISGGGSATSAAPTPPSVTASGGIAGALGGAAAAGAGRGVTAGSGGLLSRFGLSGASLSGLASVLPFLGAGLGANLGGQSQLGSVLGAVGVGAAGLAASAFAGIGIFGTGGIAGAGGALSFLPALLTNPFTLAAIPLIITAAIILGKNKARQAAEKVRNQASLDTLPAVYQLLFQAQTGDTTVAASRTAFEQIHQDYLGKISGITDSKTKRNALLWWDYIAGNAVDPGGRTTAIWPLIEAAALDSEKRGNIRGRMSPVFAGGGVSTASQMIKVRPGEGFKYPGDTMVNTIPGKDKGYDSEYMFVPRGTRIFNQSEMRNPQLMAKGGTAGGPSMNQSGDLPNLTIDSLELTLDADGLASIVISSPFFNKAVVRNVKVGKKAKKI